MRVSPHSLSVWPALAYTIQAFDSTDGITGLWQVLGRGEGLMHENTQMDLDYVRQIGLRTDLLILLRTIPGVLGSRGGY